MYKRLLEMNYGVTVRELCIVVLHPLQANYIAIKLPFMEAEVDAIFAYRRKTLNL